MIAGHLSKKAGKWYIVLELRTPQGKRSPKWISTGFTIQGNKKRAEELLYQKRVEYSKQARTGGESLFSDYLGCWIGERKGELAKATFDSYTLLLEKQIIPYFAEKEIPLSALKPADISAYHQALQQRGVFSNTIIRHHAIIHKALEDAAYHDFISANPASRVRRPQKEVYICNPYTVEECRQLLDVLQGEKLGPIVFVAIFTGMRRGELLGLRWGAIDFDKNVLHIQHELIRGAVDGRTSTIAQDKLKRKSSFRTLPMVEPIRDMLLAERQRRYGEKPVKPEEYIFVDKKGRPLKPNYISEAFPKLLAKHGLRAIRFHDLRHSCAGVLISARTPLIQVQQWLGHSSIQTTADLYSHLTFQEKLNSAETLKNFDQIEIYDLSEENRVSVSEWNARLDFEDRAKVMAFLNTGLMNDISDSEDGSYDSMILRNGQEPLLSEVTLDDDNVVEDMYCSCESGFCIHLAAMLHEIEAGHVKKCSEDEI